MVLLLDSTLSSQNLILCCKNYTKTFFRSLAPVTCHLLLSSESAYKSTHNFYMIFCIALFYSTYVKVYANTALRDQPFLPDVHVEISLLTQRVQKQWQSNCFGKGMLSRFCRQTSHSPEKRYTLHSIASFRNLILLNKPFGMYVQQLVRFGHKYPLFHPESPKIFH